MIEYAIFGVIWTVLCLFSYYRGYRKGVDHTEVRWKDAVERAAYDRQFGGVPSPQEAKWNAGVGKWERTKAEWDEASK